MNRATVFPDGSLYDPKSDSCTLFRLGGEERLEDSLLVLGLNSGPVVGDHDTIAAAAGASPLSSLGQADGNPTTWANRFEGITQNVLDDHANRDWRGTDDVGEVDALIDGDLFIGNLLGIAAQTSFHDLRDLDICVRGLVSHCPERMRDDCAKNTEFLLSEGQILPSRVRGRFPSSEIKQVSECLDGILKLVRDRS